MLRRENHNVGVQRGEWGEDVAVEYLRRGGFEIVERNPRPVRGDGTPNTTLWSSSRSSSMRPCRAFRVASEAWTVGRWTICGVRATPGDGRTSGVEHIASTS